MGKKNKKKSDKKLAVPNPSSKPNDEAPKDMYSQIFPDGSESENDDDTLQQREVVHHTNETKFKKAKRSQQEVPSPKMAKKASKVVSVEKPVRNLIQQSNNNESSSSDDESDPEFQYDDESGNEEESMNVDETNLESEPSEESEPESDETEDSEEEKETETDKHKTVLRRQLKDLSFEELEALKQKMGLKEYNEAMFGFGNKGATKKKVGKIKQNFERTNKHRPKEMSSKVRVPKLREIVKVPKKIPSKDPRFDNAYGEYNEKLWNSEYEFLRDIQKKEADQLKKNLKSIKDADKQKEMKRFIQRVTDKEKSIAEKEKDAQKRRQEIAENRKRVEEGKRPFYMKKSTKKLMDLVEKYDELKSSGRLEKYLKKKRKKNAMRDKKTLKPIE